MRQPKFYVLISLIYFLITVIFRDAVYLSSTPQQAAIDLSPWNLLFSFLGTPLMPNALICLNLLFILLATLALSRYLVEKGLHPAWVLFWSLGVGDQSSVESGLINSAAEAFLILATLYFLRNRNLLYAAFMSLAVVTQPLYLAFAGLFGLHDLVIMVKEKRGISLSSGRALLFFAMPNLLGIASACWLDHQLQIPLDATWFALPEQSMKTWASVIAFVVMFIWLVKIAVKGLSQLKAKKRREWPILIAFLLFSALFLIIETPLIPQLFFFFALLFRTFGLFRWSILNLILLALLFSFS